jgi:hypothetical protein
MPFLTPRLPPCLRDDSAHAADKSNPWLDAAFLSVWREALVDSAREILMDFKTHPFR